MENELIILEEARKINPIELFTPSGTDSILTEIRQRATSLVFDVATPQGRKDIASWAYKIAKTKTVLDDAGKSLVEKAKNEVKLVDAERKKIRDTLDALRDEVRAPLNEFEAAEQMRIKLRQERISEIEGYKNFAASYLKISDVEIAIKRVEELKEFDWQEFAFKAESVAKEVLEILNQHLKAAKDQQAKDAELERLRKEKEERDKKDHEEQIAKKAAEIAKREAEEQAEKEKARIRQEAELAIELRRKAEERTKEAERQKFEAEKKAKEDAKRAADEAVEKERKRVAEEERKEKEMAEKREANKRHRAKINNEALEAIRKIVDEHEGSSPKEIIAAIARGEVPHVSITY